MEAAQSGGLTSAPGPGQKAGARVWDLPTRVMHWGLVIAAGGAWASQELDGIPFWVHLYCGYAVLLICATRIVWGVLGTRHARFTAFVRGPRAILAYVRSLLSGASARFVGHNPLGALMVVAMLAMLLAQAVLGLFTNDEIFETGPLFGYVSLELSKQLTTFHKQLFDFILAAVAVHVFAAFFYLWVKRENLIVPMLTGRKPAGEVPLAERIDGSRSGVALLVLVVLAGGLYLLVKTAPVADLFGGLGTPRGNMLTYARLVGDLELGRQQAGWYNGYVCGVRPNEAVRDLVGMAGFGIRYCAKSASTTT